MDFSHCLSPFVSLIKYLPFVRDYSKKDGGSLSFFAEIGGRASFALLNKGIKIWRASISSRGTRFFERCCHSSEGYTEFMQREPVNVSRVFYNLLFNVPAI